MHLKANLVKYIRATWSENTLSIKACFTNDLDEDDVLDDVMKNDKQG